MHDDLNKKENIDPFKKSTDDILYSGVPYLSLSMINLNIVSDE